LQNIRKKTTPDVMLEATRSARKYGIHVRYYMMLGNRGETPESIQQSVELIKAGRPSVYMFGPLAFYPGTEDWEFLRESDGVTPDIFFKNDFKELSISANRKKEVEHILLHIKCEVGAIEGYKYTVEEREEIVGRLPQLHCAHVELANAYLRAGRLDDAWSALDRAEELDFPIAGIIHNQRACIALARNDIGNALAFLERALQSHPHFIAKQNLMNLRTWVDAPQNNLGKPPKLNDSVLSIYFREILPEL
jgi:tetratricopeptide (TPR) repeat protein